MLPSSLGHTRSSLQPDHLLQTPDTFVRTPLPGISRGTAVVHTAPILGAGFIQYTAELEAGGVVHPGTKQRFVFVLEGNVYLSDDASVHALTLGSYAYLPSDSAHTIAADTASRLVVIEKPYRPLPGVPEPGALVGTESEVKPQPLLGDEALQVRSLLPDHLSFDFAVNTMTYAPGASLSMVEIHVMEHGLLMLDGGGIYRLNERWYPVAKGDFIWMAPYCPQWFGALGKTAARYLIYKDWNRHPLELP
jgi:(S)-ureidoglycine aminohydrolase